MSVEVFQTLPPLVSSWITVDQTRINAFAEVTEDWQYIHVDPVRAAESPFGGTVAHGFLTLSLLAAMANEIIPDFPGKVMGLNYGFDRIRFVAPVPEGRRVRGHFEVSEAINVRGRLKVTWHVSVEIEGGEKPALTAEWINLFEMES